MAEEGVPGSIGDLAKTSVEFAFGFAVGHAASWALGPAATKIRQAAFAIAPVTALDPGTVAEMLAEAIDVPGGAGGEAAAHGIDSARVGALAELARTAPGVGELLTLLRRAAIDEDAFSHGLRKAKLEPQWDAALRSLRDLRVDPAVIATAIQRGIMHDPGVLPVGPPTGAGKVPPMPVSPLDALAEAAASGVNEERLAVLARIVGLPASPDLAARMVYRGLIERVDFDRAISEGNTRNEWAPFLFEGFRQILTPHEYAELRLRGWITDGAMLAGTAKHGMSADDADLLHKLLGRPIPVHQVTTGLARGGAFNGPSGDIPEAYLRSLQEGNQRPEWYSLSYANRYSLPSAFVIRALVKDGAIPPAEAETLFVQSGWPPQLAKLVAEHSAAAAKVTADPHVAKAENQLWTTIHKSYVDSESDDAEAEAALTALGVAAASIPKVLALWQHEREIVRRALTPSQVKKAWKSAKFTRDEALTRLERLGMNAADAATLLDE